jgi:acyl carrier protein
MLIEMIRNTIHAGTDDHQISDATTFGDLGLDSIGAVRLARMISEAVGIPVAATIVYSCPTVTSLIEWVDERLCTLTRNCVA